MSKFWYSTLNANNPGASISVTIEIGALDVMFLLGALEPLTIPENWEIDPDIDLGQQTAEEKQQELATFYDGIIQAAFDPPV